MSNDLISRKALLKELREITDEPHNIMFLMGIGAAISVIEHADTAFDKENVIEELKHRRDYYDINEQPKTHLIIGNVLTFGSTKENGWHTMTQLKLSRKAGLNEQSRNRNPGRQMVPGRMGF